MVRDSSDTLFGHRRQPWRCLLSEQLAKKPSMQIKTRATHFVQIRLLWLLLLCANQAVVAAMKSYERSKAEKAKLNGFLTTLVYNFRWRLPQK